MSRAPIWQALGFPALVLLSACRQPVPPPNVVVVTIDTLRADHTSAYGYSRPTTPRLAALAAQGVVFEQTYSPIPVTGPSHASLMTGLYPRAHGVVRNGYTLAKDKVTLASRLAGKGWSTAAVVSAFPVDRRFGLAEGFEHYDDQFDVATASLPTPRWDGKPLPQPYDRRADATTDRAIAWLARRADTKPFFFWVHYFDPHSPYDAPSAFKESPTGDSEEEQRSAAYDSEIRFTDHELGRLLDALDRQGLSATTLVVVTSDHGEGLGQHGEMEHGAVVYDEAVRVPLVMRLPGRLPAGRRVKVPVTLVDVAATILDLIGLPVPAAMGHSLGPVARGARPGPGDPIFLQREYDQPEHGVFAVRFGELKYIEIQEGDGRRQELFHLGQDPGELHDLSGAASKGSARLDPLVAMLRTWRRTLGQPPSGSIRPEDVEGLRALGYLK